MKTSNYRIILYLISILFLPINTYAQRVHVGLQLEWFPFGYSPITTEFTGKHTGRQYKLLKAKSVREPQKDSTGGSLSWQGKGLGYTLGINAGIHKKNWSISSGILGGKQAFQLFLENQQNGANNHADVDIFTVRETRYTISIPLKLQLLLHKGLYIEVGANYNLLHIMDKFEANGIRQVNDTLLFVLENFQDEGLVRDVNSFIDFGSNPIELSVSVGLISSSRLSFAITNKIMFQQNATSQFHFIGFTLTGDALAGNLLTKRKQIYAKEHQK